MLRCPELKEVKLTFDGGVLTIVMNRPNRKNAFNEALYDSVIQALKFGDEAEQVVLAVLTGAGDYYSSGNDLGNFFAFSGDANVASKQAGQRLTSFVDAFINFSKPLIAAVNGPAIGIAVTTLALCDVVYGSESSTYNTPFSGLGQSPEGVSSLLFPQLMGASKANEVLLFGRKLTAKEAEARNLIAEVLPNANFHQVVHERALKYAQFPPQTLRHIKKIIRQQNIELYRKINRDEAQLLTKLWISEECLQAVTSFMQRTKSKL